MPDDSTLVGGTDPLGFKQVLRFDKNWNLMVTSSGQATENTLKAVNTTLQKLLVVLSKPTAPYYTTLLHR